MKHLERRRLLAVPRSEVCFLGSDFVDYTEGELEKMTSTKENVFSVLSALCVTFSTIMYIVDIFSCASVCYYQYLEGEFWWFVMLLVPLIISLIVVNSFSLRWYLHDKEEAKSLIGEVSISHWITRIAFHVILMGPVIRFLELFTYGMESLEQGNRRRDAFKVMVLQEERDTSLLGLVGSFTKSAPQLVLEVYILLQRGTVLSDGARHAQLVAIFASVITLSLGMTSYHRALRRSTPSKLNMTITGTAMQFSSYICIISCRICALALFAVAYRHWFFVVIALHWLIMTVWLIRMKTTFCSTDDGRGRPCDEVFFNGVMGIVYVFCFMNVKDEPTRWKYAFYYTLVWLENFVLFILWFFKVTNESFWYRVPLVVAPVTSFVLGLFILAVYYKYFHPNKVSKVTTFVKFPT